MTFSPWRIETAKARAPELHSPNESEYVQIPAIHPQEYFWASGPHVNDRRGDRPTLVLVPLRRIHSGRTRPAAEFTRRQARCVPSVSLLPKFEPTAGLL